MVDTLQTSKQVTKSYNRFKRGFELNLFETAENESPQCFEYAMSPTNLTGRYPQIKMVHI